MTNHSRFSNPLIYFVTALVFFVFGYQLNPLLSHSDTVIIQKDGQEEDVYKLDSAADLGLYWKVMEEIRNKYVNEDEIDNEVLMYGSIKGMVKALGDSYTVFMDPEESQQFDASLEGTLEGIGAELSLENNNLTIISPLKNSPAEKAGLLPGDIIFQVEGEYTTDLNLFEAVTKIRGEKGTTVTLTIIREGVREPFDVTLVRDSIDIESVTVEKLENEIVYLSVNQFNDKTLDHFGKAVSEMILDEPKGLIIDLRYNGGGYLDIAVELLSYLLPSNTNVLSLVQKNKEPEITYTNGNPKLLDVPMVVLVNEGSASASEIMAGALQDHKRAVVMGTPTFGKGTVQEVEHFSDGSSLRLTIAKWLTPNGRDLDEEGLTPDIIKEISEQDIETQTDSQKNTAIEYLENL